MLSGPPLPLPNDFPIQQLLTYARQPGTLGAWVRGSVQSLHLYEVSGRATHRLLIGPDLGHLLSSCNRIVLRAGAHPVVLQSSAIIEWRALQVVTATPYLPSPEQLGQMFPGAYLDSCGIHVPISGRAPEEVLIECLSLGIPVMESRVVYTVRTPG
jgi:hypothetical protein